MSATILIVDDPPESQRLRVVAEGEGYTVQIVDSTAAAIDLLQQQPPQLVLTELRSRGIDGWDVVKAAKRFAPDAHLVFLLGNVNDGTEDILRRLDIDGHLLKPVDRIRLRTILEALLSPDALDRTTEAYLFLPRPEPRNLVEACLTDAGIFSRTFDDARTMAVETSNDPPHLVITDIGPASPHGFDLCEDIREEPAYVPILAISAQVTRSDVQRAAHLHINDLILEPLQADDLKTSALRLLRQTKVSRRSR